MTIYNFSGLLCPSTPTNAAASLPFSPSSLPSASVSIPSLSLPPMANVPSNLSTPSPPSSSDEKPLNFANINDFIKSSTMWCIVIAVLRRIYCLFSFNRISAMLYISASLFSSYFATFIFITMLSERWTHFFWRYKIINIYNKNCKTYFYPYIKQLMN